MGEEDEEPKQGSKPLVVVCSLVAGIGGYAIARYSGSAMWIPAAAAILLGVLFHKTPLKPPQFKVSIVLIGAHLVWMVTGAILTGFWMQVVIDIGVIAIGIFFLWWKPGWFSMLFLLLYQLYAMAMNGITYSELQVGTIEHKALTVHLAIRFCAIVMLIFELVVCQRAKRLPSSSSEEKPAA
ncbi:MAG: hypothetical protein AAF585_20305 [Verrucomicrobiota bacterium]